MHEQNLLIVAILSLNLDVIECFPILKLLGYIFFFFFEMKRVKFL
jgi:membrane-associated protease RseP (regulator of RpoE activity)